MSKLLEILGKGLNIDILDLIGHWLKADYSKQKFPQDIVDMDYYNNCRTHLSLKKNSPEPRNIEKPEKGRVAKADHIFQRVTLHPRSGYWK